MSMDKDNRRDIMLLLAASFCFMASCMLVNPLIAGFTKSLGAGGAVMGLVGGLMNVCSLLCRPVLGNMSDKYSKYKISLIAAALLMVSALGYYFAVSTTMVIIFRIINGIGFAACTVCLTTWVSTLFPPERIGSGMGFYGIMNALAMAVAPAIGIFLYQKFNYNIAFTASCFFATAALVLLFFTKDKGKPMMVTNVENKDKSFHLVDKNVVPIAVILMLFAIPYCATQAFLVTYNEAQNLHLNVSLYFPLYALMILVLRFTLKKYFDTVPFRTFLTYSLISATVCLVSMSLMKNFWLLMMGAFAMAGGYGIQVSVCQATAMTIAEKGRRGLANSTYYIGFDLGMALGPIIGGFIYGHANIDYFYPLFLITIPLIVIVYYIHTVHDKKRNAVVRNIE